MNLEDAVEYIAKDNQTAAQKVARKIWDSANLLAAQPALGRPGRVSGTRELVINGLPFVLPYSHQSGVIYILRVIHTSMIWPDKFQKQ
ncbi:MAG: type II toxin-antitoxin system RelE/ParE family toxin [Geopsychrobacter sp.]|nr:type II toxin-antitoxin system RelE/ParE family toxin [Geopsychrobacter sp.]